MEWCERRTCSGQPHGQLRAANWAPALATPPAARHGWKFALTTNSRKRRQQHSPLQQARQPCRPARACAQPEGLEQGWGSVPLQRASQHQSVCLRQALQRDLAPRGGRAAAQEAFPGSWQTLLAWAARLQLSLALTKQQAHLQPTSDRPGPPQ